MKNNLLNVIDFNKVNILLDGFNKTTGFVTAIIDLDGNVLSKSGWQKICTNFHRVNPETCKKCVISDTKLANNMVEGEKYHFYKCLNGLVDVAVPIIIGEEHIANLFSGQFFLENPDREFFKKQAQKYDFDVTTYLQALDEVPIIEEGKVSIAMDFLLNMTELISDMTFQKYQQLELNEALTISEEKFRLLYNNSPDMYVSVSPSDAIILFCNETFLNKSGYSKDEVIGKPIFNMYHQDCIDEVHEAFNTFLKKGVVNDKELIIKRKDGGKIFISLNVYAVRDKEGEILYSIGSYRDITEKKLASELLIKNKNRLEFALNSFETGAWELDLQTKEAWRTLKHDQVFGYDKLLPYWDIDMFFAHVLEEDREVVRGKLNKAIATESNWDFICRIKHRSGNIRWIKAKGNHEFSEQDNAIKMFGVVQDITQRKLAEENILISEKKLKNTFDISPSIICKVNVKTGYFIEASQAVKRILGYSPEEFISIPLMNYVHPDEHQSTINATTQFLNDNKSISYFENRYLCKDGSYKWMSWYSTMADVDGVITSIGSDISCSKAIEEEVVNSKQFYENIIEAVQDGIWVTDENDIVYFANQATATIAGVTKKEIEGKHIFNDFAKKTSSNLNYFYEKAKNTKVPVWYEIKIVTISGRKSYQNGWLVPVYHNGNYSGIICTIRDITEMRLAEVNLKKLSTAVEQSPSIIAITDLKGNLEYVNPRFTETTGYTSSEAIGVNPRILKSGNHDINFYKDLWKTVNSGKIWHGQFHNRKKNGELFWESASISAISNEEGKITNYVKIGEDITQQKINELELSKALDKALESDKLKSAFLANMSHEIRTPMNGILGFVGLLSDPDLSSSKIQEYSAIISKSSQRLLSTINDIIDISKIEAGEMHVQDNEVNINTLLDELLSFHKIEAEDKGLKLYSKPTLYNSDSEIITDSVKLHGILTNLIKNAIKYTKYGIITFGYSVQNEFIEFYVDDTGIGIPKDRIHAIFNRFEQADIEDVMVYEGSGLGLAISKAYTELLGGSISVESLQYKGSTFKFTIPYTPACINELEELTPDVLINDEANFSGLNLLIAEDDPDSAEYLKIILESHFKNIYFAENGLQAIKKCKDIEGLDIILMDVKMPIMDGYTATREIRKFNKDVIIIAQTAYALPGDKDKAIAAGCNEYIAKPIDQNQLLNLINTLIP